MRDENEKNEKDFLDETDDILSFMQDYSDNEKKGTESKNTEVSENDNQDVEMEDTDDDLLALLDMISAQEENSNANNNADISKNYDEVKVNSESVENISGDNPSFDDDLMAINDLLGDEAIDVNEDFVSKKEKINKSSDMGGIFSDVLSAVDTLNDKPQTDMNDSFKTEKSDVELAENQNNKQKKGFWQKIFGKGKATKENESNNNSIDANSKKSEAEKKKAEKKEAAKKEVEKKKADKLAKQKSKKAKVNTGEENSAAIKKKEAKKKKDIKKKPAVKKESKKVKKKEKVAAAAATEVDDVEDNIKLNKVAVIFVMTFFILIGGFVIIGTDLYSYTLSIKNANVAFSRQRYSEAYDEIYGLDIRNRDSKIYEKIMTVMYVNKELTSCDNYYNMKKYPEALDSLLKGFRRYDKYIDRATELGIQSDMNYVRKQIVKELKEKFNLSEKEAIALNKTEDQTKYSLNVINAALEKMN